MDTIFMKLFLSEIFLASVVLFQLGYNVYVLKQNHFYFSFRKEIVSQVTLTLLFLLFLLSLNNIEGVLVNALFLNDSLTQLIKILIVIFSLFIVIILKQVFEFQYVRYFEFCIFYLLSIFSLLLLICSNNFISIYLSLEIQALCFYILASFKRESVYSTEAGLKYFIVGSIMSGVFLFGCSYLYGFFGTLSLLDLNLLLYFPLDNFSEVANLNVLLLISISFIIFSFLYKVACAPFHFWSPDVYEGAPFSSTIIFVLLPKLAMFYVLLKIVYLFGKEFEELSTFLLYIGCFSLIIGTMFAINQKRFKRFLIFSSIAQVGLITVLLGFNYLNSSFSIYFYLLTYLLSGIIIWGVFSVLHYNNFKLSFFLKKDPSILYLTSLANLFYRNRVLASIVILLFFSIGGIPPLVGFLAKINILMVLIQHEHIEIAITILFISAISVFYYIKIIKIVCFEFKSGFSNLKFNNNASQILYKTENSEMIFEVIFCFSLFVIFGFYDPSIFFLMFESSFLTSIFF